MAGAQHYPRNPLLRTHPQAPPLASSVRHPARKNFFHEKGAAGGMIPHDAAPCQFLFNRLF